MVVHTWWQVGYDLNCGCCDVVVGKFATRELAEQAYPIVLEAEPYVDNFWYEVYEVKHTIETISRRDNVSH